MAKTKAITQAASDSNITDETLIVPAAHRTANNGIIDALYDLTVQESSVSGSYTTASSPTNLPFGLRMKKVGGLVSVQLTADNTTGGSVSNATIFTFPLLVGGNNNPFLPEDDTEAYTDSPVEFYGYARNQSGAFLAVRIFWESGTPKCRTRGTIPATVEGDPFILNFTYNAKY